MGIYQDMFSGKSTPKLDLSGLTSSGSLPAYDVAKSTAGINEYLSSLPDIARKGMLWERDNPFFQDELVKDTYTIGDAQKQGTTLRRASTPEGYRSWSSAGGWNKDGQFTIKDQVIDPSMYKYDPEYGFVVHESVIPKDHIGHQHNKFIDALPLIAALAVGVDASGLLAAGGSGGGVGGGALSTLGSTTVSDFALADAAQLAAQGLSQSQISAVMAGGGIQGTGGFLVGTGGALGTTGNALADAALNGALRGGVVSGVTGGNPLSGGLLGGVSGGFSQLLPDFGSPIINGAARNIPSAIASGNPAPLVTGGVGGGLSQVGNELGLGKGGTSLLSNVGTSVVREAMRPNPPARAYKPQGALPVTSSVHPTYGRMVPRA